MNYQLDCVNLVYDAEKDGGTAALRDVTLSLDGKGLIGIQGPSGSGKSSLLYTMAGLKSPTSGRVQNVRVCISVLAPPRFWVHLPTAFSYQLYDGA